MKPYQNLTMEDVNLFLVDMKKRRDDLALRKRHLSRRLLLPSWIGALTIIGAACLVGYLGSVFPKGCGVVAFLLIFYGGIPTLIWGIEFAQKIAGKLGFPKEEYDSIDPKIHRLELDIIRVESFSKAIDRIKKFKPRATPTQIVILDAHIAQLKSDAARIPIPSYDSIAYETIRRSIAAIQSYIERNSRPAEDVPGAAKLPEKAPAGSLGKHTPLTPTTSTLSSIPAGKVEEPRKVNQSPAKPQTTSQADDRAKTGQPKSPAQFPSQKVATQPAPTASQKPEKMYDETVEAQQVDLDISKVFSPRAMSIITKIVRTRIKRPNVKRTADYLEQYIRNRDIGHLGELFILRTEKGYLSKNNRKDLADRVIHVSQDNDALGYDILSFNLDGEEKHIEVKTTNTGYESQFFLSVNETEMMELLPNYFIYRVYNFDQKSQTGSVYRIDCAKDFEKYFRLETEVYKVTPNTR